MLVIRFKVVCQPGDIDKAIEVFEPVVAPSRQVPGVIHFDIARDLTDANALIATEVFEDADARARQEALPEVAEVMSVLPNLLAAPPEATLYHVASAEPAM
jgi:quinol monooxygenase YgiN